MTERFFESREQMIRAIVSECDDILSASLKEQGSASLLVSGGSSPKPVYELLSTQELDWANVNVALVDERWVDESHPRSNTAFIKNTLLCNEARSANFVPMYDGSASAAAAVAACNQRYAALARPFTLTILGMGPDGHTASLFPHAAGLKSALAQQAPVCAALTAQASEVTGEEVERMSLSLPGILQSELVMLLLAGDEKREVYEQAMAGNDAESMPVRAVLQQEETPVVVYWAP